MKKLKWLNLNQNRLVDIREVRCDLTPNISYLDIGGNQIDFEHAYEFDAFVDKLAEWKRLGHLIVEENPFFLPDKIMKFQPKNVIEEIIKKIRSLAVLNGDDMQAVKKKLRTVQLEQELTKDRADLAKPIDLAGLDWTDSDDDGVHIKRQDFDYKEEAGDHTKKRF